MMSDKNLNETKEEIFFVIDEEEDDYDDEEDDYDEEADPDQLYYHPPN